MKAAFSRDEKHIVAASSDGTASVWDQGGGHVATATHDGPVDEAHLVNGGALLITVSGASGAKRATLWDIVGAAGARNSQPDVERCVQKDGDRPGWRKCCLRQRRQHRALGYQLRQTGENLGEP